MPSAGSHSVHFPILESMYNRILESRLLTIVVVFLDFCENFFFYLLLNVYLNTNSWNSPLNYSVVIFQQ